jgi:hypothetical protein
MNWWTLCAPPRTVACSVRVAAVESTNVVRNLSALLGKTWRLLHAPVALGDR